MLLCISHARCEIMEYYIYAKINVSYCEIIMQQK